jgi:hypothetical protein
MGKKNLKKKSNKKSMVEMIDGDKINIYTPLEQEQESFQSRNRSSHSLDYS